MVPELTEADLQRPRTQAELRAWVDHLHDQFGRTEEGKRAVRLKEANLVKKFMEEVCGLSRFSPMPSTRAERNSVPAGSRLRIL